MLHGLGGAKGVGDCTVDCNGPAVMATSLNARFYLVSPRELTAPK